MKNYILLLFCSFSLSFYSQEINTYFNKTLIAEVGYTCMETPEPNPCAGNHIYAVVNITKENILISEKTVSTCGEEESIEIGKYKWKQLKNQIIVDYKDAGYIYAKILLLKFEDKKIIGEIEYPNGKKMEKPFIVTKE